MNRWPPQRAGRQQTAPIDRMAPLFAMLGQSASHFARYVSVDHERTAKRLPRLPRLHDRSRVSAKTAHISGASLARVLCVRAAGLPSASALGWSTHLLVEGFESRRDPQTAGKRR